MKKMICTALALAILAVPIAASAEDVDYCKSSDSQETPSKRWLEHTQTVDDWREELTEWFNFYYDLVEGGEVLTDDEMDLVFSYASAFVQLNKVWFLEGTAFLGGESYASNSDDLLASISDMKEKYHENEFFTQIACMIGLNMIFNPSSFWE